MFQPILQTVVFLGERFVCGGKRSPLSSIFGVCSVASSRCFVLLLLDFSKPFTCFYAMGLLKKEIPQSDHRVTTPTSPLFFFFFYSLLFFFPLLSYKLVLFPRIPGFPLEGIRNIRLSYCLSYHFSIAE